LRGIICQRVSRVIAGPSRKVRTGGKSGHRGFRSRGREPTPLGSLCGPRGKGDAPGNARGAATHVIRAMRFTESATENKPPVEWSTVASRRETCKTPAKADSAVRVKRWGKSPPLVWRQTRHGKPRVVQGQIGGESRPGSMSASSCCCGASRGNGEPSGRLLEPWCESRPRGMIAAARLQDRAAQNPAYRLTRYFFTAKSREFLRDSLRSEIPMQWVMN
jgi:hypothetical protein